MTKKHLLLALVLSLALPSAFATVLTRSDIQKAAEAFVNRDSVGASVLSGRTVKSVEEKDALFIVRLSPSGYIVFSGDTAAEPVVAFSTNDYTEEADDTAFGALLNIANTNAVAAAAGEYAKPLMLLKSASLSSATSASTRRAAKWAELRGTTSAADDDIARPLTAISYDVSALTVQVKPFMTTTWNQYQPFNDYAPINSETTVEGSSTYRRRFRSGCVATAYAQILNYWKWPARYEEVVSCNHSVYDSIYTLNELYRTHIRFDGRANFDWTTMSNSYLAWSYDTGYDLRGETAESLRYPVARLIMLSAVLAEMYYAQEGSGSVIETAVEKNPWYEMTNSVIRTVVSDDTTFFNLIRSDLQKGYPVAVTVPGHQIVAHGWAEDSDGTEYVYLNYGWSGSNDGYFNITETDQETTEKGYIDSALLGYTPIKTVQVNPLPDVSGSSVTLNWQAPPRISDSFEGYDVRIKKGGTTSSDWSEDFSSYETATDTVQGVFVGTIPDVENETPLLCVRPLADGSFTLMDKKVLTTCSVLTYRYRYYYALGLDVRLQARFNGGDWEDLDDLSLGDGYDELGWLTKRVFLGGRANETMSLRLFITNDRSSISDSSTKIGVQLDDFLLTDVLSFDETLVSCDKSARTMIVNNLEAGATYTFTVTPKCTGIKESMPVQTQIAGVARVPLAGEETFVATNFVYRTGDESWSLTTDTNNIPKTVGESSVKLGHLTGALILQRDVVLQDSSVCSFSWTSKGAYAIPDVLEVRFVDIANEVFVLSSITNSSNRQSKQNVNLSLSSLAGKCGTLSIKFSHKSDWYGNYSNGGVTLYDVTVTNLLIPVPPSEIAWGEETLVEESFPAISSVTSISETSPTVQEGFYRECARGTNVFFVTCSKNVTKLTASASNLTLVPDEKVDVCSLGGGKFVVTVDGSNIDDDNDRTRMIMTLAASTARGATAYKDLVLRFSSETEAEEPYQVEVTETSTTRVPVPYTWLIENNLAQEGADAAAMEEAANADTDSDGYANDAEYLFGTDPNDPTDSFKVFIAREGDETMISWAPTNTMTKYTVIGVTNLVDRTWVETNAANRAGLRFFRVRATRR